jgi:hypothetical protein
MKNTILHKIKVVGAVIVLFGVITIQKHNRYLSLLSTCLITT